MTPWNPAGLAAFRGAATPMSSRPPGSSSGAKQGKIKAAQERLKAVPPADRKAYGQRFNAVKKAIEGAFEAAKAAPNDPRPRPWVDVSLPGVRSKLGHRHPLTQTTDELIDIFGRFGFAVARGPEVEDVRHNFEALNIPASHPGPRLIG